MGAPEGNDLTIWEIGAPGAIRTPDPQIRSLMLYPAELRVRGKWAHRCVFSGAQVRCTRLIDGIERQAMKASLPLACIALLSGCAGRTTAHYPSLLPRPIESTSLAEPEPAPAAISTPDAPTDAKLATVKTTLAETESAFAPAADRAQQTATAAKGEPAG